MVGLEPVKRQVKALSAQLRMARLRAGQGLPVQPPKRHFVFSGPSGTGKTTVARILGRVFYALGLLGGDHLVEAQRSDLVGEFLGQTAVKANELIDSALGGVLFVDEAYALSNSGYSKGDAYGDEALQVLLKRAEDNRDRLVVILAGYPEGMDRLLAANPGLSSRFTTRVDFPSYRPLELTADRRRCWPRRTATVGRRGAGGAAGDQRPRGATRAGSTSWATGGCCAPLYEKSCAYRDLRLSEYPTTPSREELSTLRLPDLMQAYGEVLSGRGPAASRRPTRPSSRIGRGGRLSRRSSPGAERCEGSRTSPTSISSTSSRATRPSTRPAGSATAARWDAAAPHRGQRVVQREVGAQRGDRAPQPLRHRPVLVLQVEDVLDVQVAQVAGAGRRRRPGSGSSRCARSAPRPRAAVAAGADGDQLGPG